MSISDRIVQNVKEEIGHVTLVIEDKAEKTRPCNRRDWNATMVIKEDKAEKTIDHVTEEIGNATMVIKEDKAEITIDNVTEEIGNATMVIEDKAEKTRPCKRRDWKCNNGDRGQGKENKTM